MELRTEAGEIGKGGAIGGRDGLDEVRDRERLSGCSRHISNDPLPGDPKGHLKLAFLLAEVVGILQSAGASREDLQELNASFSAFRSCDRAELPACGKQLEEQLEAISRRYPELVSRIADLQSRIDEQIRSPACDNNLPF